MAKRITVVRNDFKHPLEIDNVVSVEWTPSEQFLEIISQDGDQIVTQGIAANNIATYTVTQDAQQPAADLRAVEEIATQFVSPRNGGRMCGASNPVFEAVTCAKTAGHDDDHESLVPRLAWEKTE